MPAAPEQEALFTVRAAGGRRKKDDPAYRPGRAWAQAARDERLAAFRAHQHECEQCMSAADVADATGTKGHEHLCTPGYILFYMFARIHVGLMHGYYPDHDRPKPIARPSSSGQGVLF
jgi:hypothetical protein